MIAGALALVSFAAASAAVAFLMVIHILQGSFRYFFCSRHQIFMAMVWGSTFIKNAWKRGIFP